MCRPRQVVGLARTGGGRAVRIGNDLTKIDFLLKNLVLGHFLPFLDLLDVRNGSGSKFRVYGWYPEVCTKKVSPFRDKFVIGPPHQPFCILFFGSCFLACVKKNAKTISNQPPHPPTLLTNTKSFNKKTLTCQMTLYWLPGQARNMRGMRVAFQSLGQGA